MARYRYRGAQRGPKRRKRPTRQQTAAVGSQIPDTPEAQLEDETRRDIERLMKMREKDLGLSEAERLLDRVIEQHSEHAELFSKAGEWTVTGRPESPFLHVALHRMVEQRVVSRQIGRFDANVPWHDAVHDAAKNIADELFSVEDTEVEEADASHA